MSKWTRRRKWLTIVPLALVGLWLLSSLAVAWFLTGRQGSGPEIVPANAGLKIEEHRLKTDDGQTLRAWLVRGKRPVAIIHLHGIGDCRSNSLPQIHAAADRGYSVLAVTLRAHGDSTGERQDFGYLTRHDVLAAVRFVEKELPGTKIVIWGQSLGAASAIFAAGDCGHRVQGYFLESPYKDMKTAVWNRCCAVPPPLNAIAYAGLRLWSPLFLPVSADKLAPVDYIGQIPADVPVTILTGAKDKHCRIDEAQALYEKVRGHGELVVVPEGAHGQLFGSNRAEYDKAMEELLGRVER